NLVDHPWQLLGAGTIARAGNAVAIYTAPSTKPNPSVVHVLYSYELEQWDETRIEKMTGTLAATITILEPGYKVSGSDGPTTYSGTVCRLDKEFTVFGHNGPLELTFKFKPSGDGRAGTGSLGGSVSVATWIGAGPYTIEGFDSENPKIVWVTDQT